VRRLSRGNNVTGERASEVTCQGWPNLPLEIMSIIAEFILGVYVFRTLESLSLTSRVVRRQIETVLYETVILSGSRDTMWRRLCPRRWGYGTYKYTK
jgi:hypothetical protein